MIQYESLIFLSGGLDSTFVCWKLLKENKDKRYLIVHCNMQNFCNREKFEREATKSILDNLKNDGLNNFDFLECGFDYGTLKNIVKDIELWGFLQATIFRNEKDYTIKNIVICKSADDANLAGYEERSKRRYNLIEAMLGYVPEFKYPIEHLTRKEMIDELPENYLNEISFCRKPGVHGKACNKCATCKETIKYLKNKNIIKYKE